MQERILKPHGMNLRQFINIQLASRNYRPVFEQVADNQAASYRFAALASNERIDKNLFKAIKNHTPDGYVVSVGCGMSMGLPLGFKLDKSPKGIVLVDVDKHVIALSKALINAIKQTKNPTEFYNLFYVDPITNAKKFLKEDPEELATFEEMGFEKEEALRLQIERSRGSYQRRISEKGRPNIDNILVSTYDKWKVLINEGRVAIIHGSLIDKEVIDTITSLPEYSSSTNIIYLSNIIDHIVSRKSWESADSGLSKYLQALEKYNPKEHPAIFLDTLRNFNYWLRASKGVPDICVADLKVLHPTIFPEDFKLPDLHFKKKPKRFTPLDLSKINSDKIYEILFNKYPNIKKEELLRLIYEIADNIFYFGNVDKKYYADLKPIDWVRLRLGNIIGQAVINYLLKKNYEYK